MFLYAPHQGSSLSTLIVTREHRLGLAGARLAAEAVVADIDSRFPIEYEWTNDRELTFRGSSADGTLILTEETIELALTLGLFLLPMRSVIEREIFDYMERMIPCPDE